MRDGRDAGAEPLSSLVGGVLRRSGVEEGVRRATALLDWDRCVGERIAEVSRVTGVEGGTIHVEVRSSVWLQELSFIRRDILARLNETSQDRFDRIVFRLAGSMDPRGEANPSQRAR